MSRLAGVALVFAGTVAGVLAAGRIPVHVPAFVLATGVVVVGLLLLRRARGPGGEPPPGESGGEAFRPLAAATAALAGRADDVPLEELRRELDRLATGPAFEAIAALPALAARLGLARYAPFASAFARGERAISRAWSAASDGHREEALAWLPRAADAFAGALSLLEGGEPGGGV